MRARGRQPTFKALILTTIDRRLGFASGRSKSRTVRNVRGQAAYFAPAPGFSPEPAGACLVLPVRSRSDGGFPHPIIQSAHRPWRLLAVLIAATFILFGFPGAAGADVPASDGAARAPGRAPAPPARGAGAAPATPAGARAAPQRRPAAQALPPPQAAAILPFVSLRRAADEWIGAYVQDALRHRIQAGGTIALLTQDASSQRAALLGLAPLAAPSGAQWNELGLNYVIVGTVQRVLDRADLKVRVLGKDGDLLQPAPLDLSLDLGSDPPGDAVAPLLAKVGAALNLPEAPAGKATGKWSAVETVYRLAAQAAQAGDDDTRARLVADLQAFAAEPAVAGVALETVARLRLERALLTLKDAEQLRELGSAAEAAQRALDADPADTERRALQAEIHFFLRQDYLAKTEASVARLKNPLDGLAWVVLGLVAGPSSGEGTNHFKRARQANPFLWQSARAPATPPFQAGILEGTLGRWAAQRAAGDQPQDGDRAARAETKALQEGISAFEARRFEAADAAFRKAAEQDEYDYRPVLYQLRILIETGRSAEAVAPLRDLAAENPLELEVLLFLGIAQEKSAALDEAQQTFQHILQDDPQQSVALLHVGLIANARRAWRDALVPLRTLVKIEPGNADAWLQLGIAQANLEQWPAADQSFRQVLAVNPESRAAQEWRAKIRTRLAR